VLFLFDDAVAFRLGLRPGHAFVHWRGFGFGEIARGNLPLWNPPHLLRGSLPGPVSQSALLYPLNVLYLALPLAKAINWGIALHAFLGGLFFYLWASSGACTRWPASWRAPSSFLRTLLPSHLRGAPSQSLHHDLGPAVVSGH